MNSSGFAISPFRPAWWLPGPHLQTLGARFLRPDGGVQLFRERVELSDGDFVDLDFTFDPSLGDPGRPLVMVLHGLEGSAHSRYALETYRRLAERGIAAVGFNCRSCSGELNRKARMYHSGDTADLEFLARMLLRRFPSHPMGAVGFSLGGNMLLKLLGTLGDDARDLFRAAVAVSVPFDLSAGADHLERPGGRLYTWYLLRKLRRKVRAKRHMMPAEVDVGRALAATSFREFDDAATAPLHSFDGAEDYYRRSSSGPFIENVQIPTLLVQAGDDPFQPQECIPKAATSNPNITTAFLGTGGHVGFLADSTPWKPVFWAEREAARFIATMLGVDAHSKPASVSA